LEHRDGLLEHQLYGGAEGHPTLALRCGCRWWLVWVFCEPLGPAQVWWYIIPSTLLASGLVVVSGAGSLPCDRRARCGQGRGMSPFSGRGRAWAR
jgi:hypothetical protein